MSKRKIKTATKQEVVRSTPAAVPEWKVRATRLFRSLHKESPFEADVRTRRQFLPRGWTGMAEKCDTSIHSVLHQLVPLCQLAHEARDAEALRSIYGFAEWCLEKDVEGDVDLGNAAGVSFYEHIIESTTVVEQLAGWLTPEVFRQVRGLFEVWLEPEIYDELMRRCADLVGEDFS